jgi:hypothetical protein
VIGSFLLRSNLDRELDPATKGKGKDCRKVYAKIVVVKCSSVSRT